MKAPERIWAWTWTGAGNEGQWHTSTGTSATEYVRADLFADLEAEKQAQITDLALQCLVTDGQAEEALARADRAEGLLKEAVEALIDASSALDYIRFHYGELHGVGFDRVRDKHDSILAAIKEAKDNG
jgi:hypothetical protein